MTTTPAPIRAATTPPTLRWLALADRLLTGVTMAGLVLVLPVSLLLFLQWPLRDFGIGYSREANDLAQWLFAIYVSIALTYATRRHTHLTVDVLAHRYSAHGRRRWTRLGAWLVLVPWSSFVLYAGWSMMSKSLRDLEAFPDTGNPGYFLIVMSMWLLTLLVLLQALVDGFCHRAQEH